jgi:hypothetical protein
MLSDRQPFKMYRRGLRLLFCQSCCRYRLSAPCEECKLLDPYAPFDDEPPRLVGVAGTMEVPVRSLWSPLFHRMEQLIDRKTPAASLFSGPYYFVEQLGFRKVIDSTFMMATLVTGDPNPEDVGKFFRALRRAQRDIDLRPELYTHYYKREFPTRFHDQMDTRRWGPGERIVFEPYTRDVFEESFQWIAERPIFAEGGMGECNYDQATVSVPAE